MKIELHSAEEVADTLGVELDTLYRYARKGRIHGLKVGKAWRFSDFDIQEFLHKQRYCARSDAGAGATQSLAPHGSANHPNEASYADVDAASDLLGENLRRHGVTQGGRVLILLSNSLEFVVACFAVWKIGAILVPESPAVKRETLSRILHECAPQALILDRDVAERLGDLRQGLEQVRVVYVKSPNFNLPGLGPVRMESLDAVLDAKNKVLHLTGSTSENLPAINFAARLKDMPPGSMNPRRS